MNCNKWSNKKIFCTLGPASMNERVIARLTDLGVSLFRINLSHTRLDDLVRVIDFIQSRTAVPICLDTEGAQIRTGDFVENQVVLAENSLIRIPKTKVSGNAESFNLYPLDIVDKIEIGDIISIDFNSVLIKVIEKNGGGLIATVLSGGRVGQNKAVSADREIHLSALTDKDIKSLAIGMNKGIKHVALSFANSIKDVEALRAIVDKDTYIISKIESIKGIKNLGEIASRSDALLLDRGDLSRQVSIEQIPQAQKEIIRMAKQADVEIFVATNLLESMTTVAIPTRAEVNDVFNTLADGADGLVLAAETAVGSFPVECVIMISKIIKQFSEFQYGSNSFFENLERQEPLFLIEPHGGILIDRCEFNHDQEEIKKFKRIIVKEKDIINVEQIAIGSFSPLKGFMTREEVYSVLERYNLPNGIIWPLPITLQIDKKIAEQLNVGQKVNLCLKDDQTIYAILDISDIFTYDLKEFTLKVFDTSDAGHPGVEDILNSPDCFLGGEITLIQRLKSKNKHFEMTPKQVRRIFEHKGWSRIVGFHTRNVAHRAHEYMQKVAFERHHCDGAFIHPLTGPKKKGDYRSEVILKSYEMIIKESHLAARVLLAGWQNYPRYSGPREAVFTAICRKNFGCSHFVVGRDHSGINGYYPKDGSRKLFDKLGDIGIIPIFFNEVHYCRKCENYVEDCGHEAEDILRISGTQGREMLRNKVLPPDWFMRKELSRFIIDSMNEGKEIFQT